jgi:hypothetical protein
MAWHSWPCWRSCSLDDAGYAVAQTKDGSYFIARYTNSNDGAVTGNHGGSDHDADRQDKPESAK